MSEQFPVARSLESMRKEAKRWLHALRNGDADARARLLRTTPDAGTNLTLRAVQHALAREHGFAGWTALKEALEAAAQHDAPMLTHYEEAAAALLDAYRTGTLEAMERHYRLTWHRRAWPAMRTYVQLDLGKRPTSPGDNVEITLDDARYLVAVEHGFGSWAKLVEFTEATSRSVFVASAPLPPATKPVEVARSGASGNRRTLLWSRDWSEVLSIFESNPDAAALHAHGQMTDAALDALTSAVSGIATANIEALDLSGSQGLSDRGVQILARLPQLRRLDLGGTGVTDRALMVLRELPLLEALSLSGTRVTDDGMRHLAHCDALRRVELMWTRTGDGAIAALGGKVKLTHFASGSGVTDKGLRLLHELPRFATWSGGDDAARPASGDAPNELTLRGTFTDDGMQHLARLQGLAGLNVDDRALAISAASMIPLRSLPHLGWLSVDAKDDWMPHIAAMQNLRVLGIQDTTAGDDGFVALSTSPSIERIWGRRCHNLRTRGFIALAHMPKLNSLSVSCLNVGDDGVATLPMFPALRELMPMDIPDAGYRHIGRCEALESLVLMYCRDTTDAATEQITGLSRLRRYFNSYTMITDRTPELLSTMQSLEEITFDACHGLTDAGLAQLAQLPRLRTLRVAGRGVSAHVCDAFGTHVEVFVNG